MAKKQDPKKFKQHLPVLKVPGCARRIETCKLNDICLLPFKKKDGTSGMRKKKSNRTLYIIRNCSGEKPCIFNAREMANSMLAERCHVANPKLPCNRQAQPEMAKRKKA